ncbi:hypothetical protein J7D27_22025 [Escherichia coli]|uniref:hypothetical protein n=1 Tax=Enterobacteriaceae TaxID=543 RepID=UPI0012FFB92D|nr:MULTISPECIES: hypothetical protein [Enterobacteriaceae]EFD3773459.1 hypothetical protein [Escherichia coli]EIB0572281.1 hypothetical protein [Escherichia coli]MBP0565350.1 hypothetical protein [Escherichia coli]MDI2124397.1 hypothetical protein [Shigella sonnei]MDO2717576.1 hypothetical protein [Escherichia coli]
MSKIWGAVHFCGHFTFRHPGNEVQSVGGASRTTVGYAAIKNISISTVIPQHLDDSGTKAILICQVYPQK